MRWHAYSTSTFRACPVPSATPRVPLSIVNCNTLPQDPERTCMRVSFALPVMFRQNTKKKKSFIKEEKKSL